MVTTNIGARMLGFTQRHIQTMCALGKFKTAIRFGYGERGHWRISRLELSCKKCGVELSDEPLNLKRK